MKAWKLSLLTTVVFSAFIVILLYTACEKNPCDNVTCFNGGSCNVGTCRCPVGWEDPQCQTKSVQRYVGNYVGYVTCNGGAQLIDSANIYPDNAKINYVYIALKSLAPKVLHGFVSNNESTYSVIIPNDSATNYLMVYTVTLQGDTRLNIQTYETNETKPGDTVINKCIFLGTKY